MGKGGKNPILSPLDKASLPLIASAFIWSFYSFSFSFPSGIMVISSWSYLSSSSAIIVSSHRPPFGLGNKQPSRNTLYINQILKANYSDWIIKELKIGLCPILKNTIAWFRVRCQPFCLLTFFELSFKIAIAW